MQMDATYYQYWGKARKTADGKWQYHLLPYHCLDVAAVGRVWVENDLALRERLSAAFTINADDTRLLDWLEFILALHDIGKFDIRFQLKVPEVHSIIWPDLAPGDIAISEMNIREFDHGLSGYGLFVKQAARNIFADDIRDNMLDVWGPWIAAVTGHHGIIPRQVNWTAPCAERNVLQHDQDARLQWLLAVADLFLKDRISKYAAPTLSKICQPLIAGFCSVADWIASNEVFVRWIREEIALCRYFEQATVHCRMTGILQKAGIVGRQVAAYADVKSLLPDREQPRQIQTIIDDLPTEAGLMIVEGTTGSGKTEAALAMAWRIIEDGHADSIVFALPTQATADAMLERIENLAPILYNSSDTNLVLAHGKAKYNKLFANLKAACRPHAEQEGDQGAVQCAEWISASRKRVFLGQIGICTVDQVLLSVLPVRHNFVRSFGVAKSVLIIDEVHAYDRYMYALLEEVLKRQKAAGGSAIMLSATLPAVQKKELFEAWHKGSGAKVIADAPYPLLSKLTVAGIATFTAVDIKDTPPRRVVGIDLLETDDMEADEAFLEKLASAAESGAMVAVVCNLVQSAQKTARRLRAIAKVKGVAVDVFHARYRFKDRQVKEKAAKKLYGKDAPRDAGRILVATQVIEQSLDLDFDWLITQLCPVDLLFQRIGRLHRHERTRPKGHEVPRCTVLTNKTNDFGAHEMIYGDTRILWRTREMLKGSSSRIVFPAAYRMWIERVYGRDEWVGEEEPVEVIGKSCAFRQEQQQAQYKAIMLAAEGINPFADTDQNASSLTRGKEMGLNIVPIIAGESSKKLLDSICLAEVNEFKRQELLNMNAIPVPASWKDWLPRFEDGYIYLPMVPNGNDWLWKNGKYSLSYSLEFGLERMEETA